VTNVLQIAGLRGGYSEVDILNGLELEDRAQEILMIAVPNGSGKSTMAKAILGILPRSSGRIVFDGQDLGRMPSEQRVRRGIGYVPQVANVFPSLTVTENLQVVEPVPERRAQIKDMFETFPALLERRNQRAGSLSGGERQQLAFARALMTRPKLIVLDEPTANISPKIVTQVFQHIRRMPDLGTAVLLIEQRAREALAIADRGYILAGGKVVANGRAADLAADDTLAKRFLGQGRG